MKISRLSEWLKMIMLANVALGPVYLVAEAQEAALEMDSTLANETLYDRVTSSITDFDFSNSNGVNQDAVRTTTYSDQSDLSNQEVTLSLNIPAPFFDADPSSELNTESDPGDSVNRSAWTQEQFWDETKLSFDQAVFGNINTKSCLSDTKYFLGCINAISKSYTYLQKKADPKIAESISYFVIPSKDAASQLPGFQIITFDNNDKDIKTKFKTFTDQLYAWFDNYKKVSKTTPGAVWMATFSESTKVINTIASKYPSAYSYVAAQMVNSYYSRAVDPHTMLWAKNYVEELGKGKQDQGPSGDFGITFDVVDYQGKKYLAVESIEANGPAFASVKSSGLDFGDLVVSVNGETNLEKQASMIDDAKVTKANFKFQGNTGVKTVSIARSTYAIDTVQARILPTIFKVNFGYIKLTTFMDKVACKKIANVAEQMSKLDVKGLILDLRENGGGIVGVENCISSLFLELNSKIFGKTVATLNQATTSAIETAENAQDNLNQAKNINYVYSTDPKFPRPFANIPTVTLVNGYSASASEVLSLYLQSYEKTYVVGERTFGKGTEQAMIPLNNNPSVFKAKTSGKYYGPQGISPQLQGVTPDFITFPRFTQKEATSFLREEDRYENPVAADQKKVVYTQQHSKNVQTIQGCLTDTKIVEKIYNAQNEYTKLVLDNQLYTGVAVLGCFLSAKLAVNKSIDLPVVN